VSTFTEMLQAKWDERKFVCVGLDSDAKKLPECLRAASRDPQVPQLAFNQAIVDSTKDLVCAYKPNLAFYRGSAGKQVLQATISYIKANAPDVPVILDAKQADIGNTNDGYVEEDFDWYGADAVTVHPFLGMEAVRPFLDRSDKGIIVLCRTSNEGAGEFQDEPVPSPDGNGYVPLYQKVAYNVSRNWNYNGNCAVVVGATYPEELGLVRQIVGDLPILIPGIGAQGGDLAATVSNGRDGKGQGMIINNSRGVIFASGGEDYASAARTVVINMHNAIDAVLSTA